MGEGERRGGLRSRPVRFDEAAYPRPLRHIFQPPEVLYVQGEGDAAIGLSGLAIAVVGARDATGAGLAMARSLGRGLAECGVAVVSGLALGIDAAAHRGALEASGDTVAVVGSGTDVVYPWRNRALREEILRRGLVVGEWAPGTRPRRGFFPARNRIISGLSLGVVVVEATARSGALSTARWALEQGREVFAVPGPAGAPRASGPHGLLKAGARLVETVHDILDELPLDALRSSLGRPAKVAGPTAALFEALLEGAQTVDAMAARTGRKTEEIWAQLLDLEVRGHVLRGPGGRFVPGPGVARVTTGVAGLGLDSDARGELGAPPKAKEERWRRTS